MLLLLLLVQPPLGCQYWKNNKSILPAVQEDGIVGLTFSPSGDSLVHINGRNSKAGVGVGKERRINEINAFKSADGGDYDPPQTKGDLFHSSAASSGSGGGGSRSAHFFTKKNKK